jgi:4-amino-4-deoxy-L-arabinose transferase-like glycosyltransferase
MRPLTVTLAFAFLVVVYATGSVLDLMEVDAAQYGIIAQQVMASPDPTVFHFRGEDYLDKPPLLFWLSAVSFKLFGVHNWSYKLPSILAAMLALYATYRLARLHHGRDTGLRAALMLGSSLAMVLMTNDVRCDTLLMASVITAIWCGAEHLERPRGAWWLAMAVALAAGLLTKGPMGLVAPMMALGSHVLLKGRWAALRDPRLFAALLVVAVLLVPMCIGLYRQFGAHGLRFFFWEQSFGRITGENVWRDDTTPLFFLHELPWQVLPWTIPVLVGTWHDLRQLFSASRARHPEWIVLPGALLVLIAISASQFKLPHYLYVVHPLFCILGAKALVNDAGRGLRRAQAVVTGVLVTAGGGVMAWSFPGALAYAGILLALLAWLFGLLTGPSESRLMRSSFTPMVVLALVLNLHFYPQVLRYQANAQVGRWLRANQVPPDRFHAIGAGGTALDHYYGRPVRYAQDAGYIWSGLGPGSVVYVNEQVRADLLALGLKPKVSVAFPDHRVQFLSPAFLDPARREGTLDRRYVLVF